MNPITGLDAQLTLLSMAIFGMGIPYVEGPRRSSRAYVPPKERLHKKNLRKISKASKRRNRGR